MIDLSGKSAVVTGSARGLGRGIAEKLAQLGAQVVISDVNAEGAEQAAAEIRTQGYLVDVFAANVADKDQAHALIQFAIEKYGKLDILVNNAGINRDAMLHKMSMEQWDSVIAVNLTGVFNCLQPAAQHMRERQTGRIINISSASWMGNVGQANYAASKAGVMGLTYTLALEYARYNINVNAVSPGATKTPMTAIMPPEALEKIIASIPLKRMAEPEDIAGLHAFLSSKEAAYITGQVIFIDGGISVGI